jgi:hypothetical protein
VAGKADASAARVDPRPAAWRVVQERSEAQRLAVRELVGQRLCEQVADRGGVAGQAGGRRIGLQRHGGVEHFERVVVHVAVVVDALLHAAQLVELGQDHRRDSEGLEASMPARTPGARTIRRSSAKIRSPADARQAGCVAADRGGGVGLDRPAALRREAPGAQRPQGILGERALRHHPDPAAGEVLAPAERVHDSPPAERLGHRVDGEVARGEVGAQVAVAQRDEVDLPAAIRAGDAPGAEGLRERERARPRRARQRPGDGPGVARHGHVEILGRAAQQAVADRAADEPRGLAREHGPERVDGRRHERTCTRGTRAESRRSPRS